MIGHVMLFTAINYTVCLTIIVTFEFSKALIGNYFFSTLSFFFFFFVFNLLEIENIDEMRGYCSQMNLCFLEIVNI